jgi:hypothetical protein
VVVVVVLVVVVVDAAVVDVVVELVVVVLVGAAVVDVLVVVVVIGQSVQATPNVAMPEVFGVFIVAGLDLPPLLMKMTSPAVKAANSSA